MCSVNLVDFFKSFKIYWEVPKCRFETLVFFVKVFFSKKIFFWGFWSLQQFDLYWLSWQLYGKLGLFKKQLSVYLWWQLSVNGKKHAASSAKLCKVSSSWDKVFKNGPSKIYVRQPLKFWRGMVMWLAFEHQAITEPIYRTSSSLWYGAFWRKLLTANSP